MRRRGKMTQVIINDILPLTQIIAMGGQLIFSTDWTANYASDVVVYSRATGVAADDATQILSPTLYSVAFIGDSQTVEVTLVNASTAADVVTITRMTPASRTNLYSNTNFVPSMLNNDFGILTLVDQQAQLVNQQVAPRYNYSELLNIPGDTILPYLQASQIWVKNSNNTAIVAANINTISAGSVNLGTQNDLAFYAATGTVVQGLPTANKGVLVTDSIGAPSWLQTIANRIFAGNSMGAPSFLATANNGVLVTDSSGIPSIASLIKASNLLPLGNSGVSVIATTNYDLSTASGTKTITGLPFQPSLVIFLCGVNSTTVASWGIDNGSASIGIGFNGSVYSLANNSVQLITSSGNAQLGSISSFTGDGFVITFTKTGTPTGTSLIGFLAFK